MVTPCFLANAMMSTTPPHASTHVMASTEVPRRWGKVTFQCVERLATQRMFHFFRKRSRWYIIFVSKLRRVFQASVDGSDLKSTRLNSSHANISYAVFCLK